MGQGGWASCGGSFFLRTPECAQDGQVGAGWVRATGWREGEGEGTRGGRTGRRVAGRVPTGAQTSDGGGGGVGVGEIPPENHGKWCFRTSSVKRQIWSRLALSFLYLSWGAHLSSECTLQACACGRRSRGAAGGRPELGSQLRPGGQDAGMWRKV